MRPFRVAVGSLLLLSLSPSATAQQPYPQQPYPQQPYPQQPSPQQPATRTCIPGTNICLGGNGEGGLGAGGGAGGQVGPNGASGHANGGANGNGNANGNGQVPPSPSPPAPPQVAPPASPVEPSPPVARWVPPAGPPTPSNDYSIGHGSWQSGILSCGIVRAGFWSGFHFGGCLALPVRLKNVGFDFLETQLTAGGTIPTFDVVVSPVSGLVPLASDGLWQHAYLRLGVQAGYSWPTTAVGHELVRGGGHAGIGYEWDVAPGLALRLVDLRFVGEVTGNDADRLGHAYDLGVMFSSGLVLK